MKSVNVRIPEHLHNAVFAKAREEGRSVSDIVRMLLLRYVGKRAKVTDPLDTMLGAWPSGWPKAVSCPRCPKVHDPMEHPANGDLLDYAKSQVPRLASQ